MLSVTYISDVCKQKQMIFVVNNDF